MNEFKADTSTRNPGVGGVLGQVSDRGAEHHLWTRNSKRYKGQKKGVETIHFAQFLWKIGVEIFLIFAKIYGVETKGGWNGGAYVVTFI